MAVVQLLEAIREVSPLTCFWTLRRFDEVVNSLLLQVISGMGEQISSIEAVRERFRSLSIEDLDRNLQLDGVFAKMQALEDAVSGQVAYVRYDPGGTHNRDLLVGFGLPAALVDEICDELAAIPRANTGLGHKQLVAQLAMDVSEASTLRFESDSPCVLLTPELRRDLHRRMCESARRQGFEPYLRFFSDEDAGDAPPASRLTLDMLSAEDLALLACDPRPAAASS